MKSSYLFGFDIGSISINTVVMDVNGKVLEERYDYNHGKPFDKLKEILENNDLEGFRQLIVDLEIADPVSGSRNWTDVKQFNLMFKTSMGAVADDAMDLYLRPETAQGKEQKESYED